MIYVTHDQVEAMTLGQRSSCSTAAHRAGRHAARAVRAAANLFVAGFLGSPRMNFIPAALAGSPGGAVTLGVRPEHLALAAPRRGLVDGTLGLVEYLGDVMLAYVQLEGVEQMVAAKLAPGTALPAAGSPVGLRWDAARACLFDARGERI
jgi:multiple sugar transport system ATP-binding protein